MKYRTDDDKKKVKHYIYKLNRIESKIIIPYLLKKCPELRLQTKKTAAELRKKKDYICLKSVPQKMLKLNRKGE